MDKIKKSEILRNIDLGNSVAEYDDNLAKYYITTNAARDFINDRYDIVQGVKGAGKTAMLISVCDNQASFEQLDGKILIKAIELKGDPDFNRAFKTIDIVKDDIDKLKDAWKIYILNVIWKNVKDIFSNYENVEKSLKSSHLLSEKKGGLELLLYALQRAKLKVKSAFSPNGNVEHSVEISANELCADTVNCLSEEIIDFNRIFSELNSYIASNDSCVWLLLDRLDDAFPDNTATDSLILKALLYAYKDICIYSNLKIKIFIRDDIFFSVTANGFTSLTHVAAKTMPSIKWERDTIEKVLVERLLHNELYAEWMESLGINVDCKTLTSEDRKKIIYSFIKQQIDVGENNPDAIGWIINHVKDGTGIFTPRDILNLLDYARSIQIEMLDANNIEEIKDDFLISAPAVRAALARLSKNKIETQLFAEYPKCMPWILKFKEQKAEQTESSLSCILGKQWKFRVSKLVEIGFFEEKRDSYKIPFVYRDYLKVSQGKAK